MVIYMASNSVSDESLLVHCIVSRNLRQHSFKTSFDLVSITDENHSLEH